MVVCDWDHGKNAIHTVRVGGLGGGKKLTTENGADLCNECRIAVRKALEDVEARRRGSGVVHKEEKKKREKFRVTLEVEAWNASQAAAKVRGRQDDIVDVRPVTEGG